jgi:large subunit ribosomal protein L7Ae
MDKHESARRQWGGGIMGPKAQMKTEKKRKALELATKI